MATVEEITDDIKEKVVLNLLGDKVKEGQEQNDEQNASATNPNEDDAENRGGDCVKDENDKSEETNRKQTETTKTDIELLEEKLKAEEEKLTEDELNERHKVSQQLKGEANNLFKDGLYNEAVTKYTEALAVCPLSNEKDRSILYANKAAALMGETQNKEALPELNRALELDPKYLKALERRARLHKVLDNLDSSLKDYEQLLEMKPKHCEYMASIAELKERIRIRNEELKNKMMDSLKQLGNVFLKPFGLSTDNFKMQQNPDGTYNMQMQNN